MRPPPRNRTLTAKATAATPNSRSTTRSRSSSAKAATATQSPRPMTRTASGQAPPKHPRLTTKIENSTVTSTGQPASVPINPPGADESLNTSSNLPSTPNGMDTDADALPQWLLELQPLPTPTLAELLTPVAVIAKTYSETILSLPQPIRYRIFDFIFEYEDQTDLSTFGDWQEWKAPAILRLNHNFMEDALPAFLRRTTLVIHRGEEFSVAKVLSSGPARSAVVKLDFPRAYLNGSNDLRIFEIMRACLSLREVTLDICVDHLLRPVMDKEGVQVSWEPMPHSDVDKRYSIALLAQLPNLAVLKYRLVGNCYGWKRQFVQPLHDEIATLLSKFTSGRLALQSLGWCGLKENGYGSRLPTVRGDGLALAKERPDTKDCSL